MALQQLVNAIVFGSVLTLFALGLSLAWGTLDVLNLAHGSMFVFAGFLAYEISSHATMPFVVLVLCCMVATGIATAFMELVAFRHVRRRFASKRQAEMSMLVASIGFSTMLDTIVGNETSDTAFGPAATAFTVHTTKLGSVVITNIEIIIVAVTLVVAIALDLWVRRSRTGRAVRSIAFDPAISSLLGIDVNRLAAATMFVAGALAGLAGVLLAVYVGAEDTSSGQSYMLTAFAILIVGGVGSVRGAIASAFFIAIAETAVIAYGPSNWNSGVAFLLILLVLLIRPAGLFARTRFQRDMTAVVELASIGSWFTNNQVLLENILIAALLAFSVQVALRTGIFSLAGIGFYAVGSYTAALLVKDGWPAVLAILAALALCAIIGYLLAVLLVRLRDLYLAMATFAFDLMVGVVALNWGGLTGGALGVNLIPVSVSLLALILTTIGVAVLLSLLEIGTLGRTLSALREDEQLAISFAIDARRYRRFAFVISGMLGCLAGAMHALIFNEIQAQDASFSLIVATLTMVILGGFGSWVGAALGAFLLTWLPMRLTGVGVWWPVYYGGATVIVATFLPGGLFGLLRTGFRAASGLRARRGRLPAAAAPPPAAAGEGP